MDESLKSAYQQGATAINYVEVTGFRVEDEASRN